MFDRPSLWSIYHSFFSGLIFLIFEGLEVFLLLGVTRLLFFSLIYFFFFKPTSGFFFPY